MAVVVTTLCAVGDISVGDNCHIMATGLTPGHQYVVSINHGPPSLGPSTAPSSGILYVASYTSAIGGDDVLDLKDRTLSDALVGTWDHVHWVPPNPGPPVTPAIPPRAYCPTPVPVVIKARDWNQIDWPPCITCDAGHNDGMFYDVLRSTSSGGTYTAIATNLTGTSYRDEAIAGGTNYFYKVMSHTSYYSGAIAFNSISAAVAALAPAEIWGSVAG